MIEPRRSGKGHLGHFFPKRRSSVMCVCAFFFIRPSSSFSKAAARVWVQSSLRLHRVKAAAISTASAAKAKRRRRNFLAAVFPKKHLL